MSLFESESEMQNWLCNELEKDDCYGLADLIIGDDALDSYKPSKIEEEKVKNSYEECLSALYCNEIISKDENISLKIGETLRPDILLYSPEQEGVVLVELKNIKGPSRQAGTEIGAYSGELRTYMPFLSDGDLYRIIVSPVWPVLLRHYVFHEIFWQNQNILCLEPVETTDGIKLKIVEINAILEADTATKISSKHITGYQLCLYDDERYKKDGDRQRLDKYLPQMEAALNAMAIEGEAQNGNGFAFLWKENNDQSLSPYNISVFNLAPFQSIERFLHEVKDLDELSVMQKRFVNLVQSHGILGHGKSLINLTQSGSKFLEKICKPRMEGFVTWQILSEIMLDRGILVAFKGWGTFGKIFNEKLLEEYNDGNYSTSSTCPDIGLKTVLSLINPKYSFIDLSGMLFDFDLDGS